MWNKLTSFYFEVRSILDCDSKSSVIIRYKETEIIKGLLLTQIKNDFIPSF